MILRNHERRPRFRARQPPPFACHCEPVRGWGPRKGTPFAGGGAPRERCSPLAFRRRGAWRTLRREVWQSVLPAGKPGKVAAVWANSLRLTNSPKVLLFFAPCRGVTDCHVASLLAIITCFHTTINENVIYWRRGRSSLSYPRSGRSTTI